MKRGRGVRRSSEMWRMAVIHCTASAEQTVSRLGCSSPTRIRGGSMSAVRALRPTRLRSCIGTSEPGTRNRSPPLPVERVEAWKARRLNEGRSPSTVLRDLFTLSSVLRRAVKAGELTENPVRRVDKPRVDRRGWVRFLDQAEEARLRDALKERDEEMQ